jgi:hypothetical protein
MTPLRVDREDEPAAETVVVARGVLPITSPAMSNATDGSPARGAEEVVPALGRIAWRKAVSRSVLESRGRCGRARLGASLISPQAASGPFHEREEPVAGSGLGVLAPRENACALGQRRTGKLEAVVAAQELEASPPA